MGGVPCKGSTQAMPIHLTRRLPQHCGLFEQVAVEGHGPDQAGRRPPGPWEPPPAGVRPQPALGQLPLASKAEGPCPAAFGLPLLHLDADGAVRKFLRRGGQAGKESPKSQLGVLAAPEVQMEQAGNCLNTDGAALVAAQRSRREAFARLLDHVSASDCEQRVQVSLIGETERPGFGAAALAVPMAGARAASWAPPPRFCFMLPGQPALVPGNHRRRVNSDVRQRLSRLHACAASSPLWTNSPPPCHHPCRMSRGPRRAGRRRAKMSCSLAARPSLSQSPPSHSAPLHAARVAGGWALMVFADGVPTSRSAVPAGSFPGELDAPAGARRQVPTW